MKKWILLFALCAAGQQTAVFGQIADSVGRQAWAALAQPGSSSRWLKIRDDVKLTPRTFFEKSRAALGLSDRDEFRLLRSNTDEMGMTHHRFQQYHKGYRIEGATYILHETDGRVATANGNLYNTKDLVEPVASVMIVTVEPSPAHVQRSGIYPGIGSGTVHEIAQRDTGTGR